MTSLTKKNGCHNRAPYRASLMVQDGWKWGWEQNSRVSRMVTVPFRMAPDCNYTHTDLGRADAGCLGCRWRAD